MRINVFLASATRLSRRAADAAIRAGRVSINGQTAQLGLEVGPKDIVKLDGRIIDTGNKPVRTVMLNKPAGFVCSRDGQGSKTIYDILPAELHHLKPVGRLDKDSSGLILLTNDGQLANFLTHPRHQKKKIYNVTLNKALAAPDEMYINKGVKLEDGISKLDLAPLDKQRTLWQISMSEGRNRQIRRTFESLGYKVIGLHRSYFGPYKLDALKTGDWQDCQKML